MTSYYARTQHRRRSRESQWNFRPDGLVDALKSKPEALLLIGAGVALLMRNGGGLRAAFESSGRLPERRSDRRDFANYRRSSASERSSYQPTGEDGSAWSRESSEGMMSSARETMRDARDNASRMAGEASESMTHYASDMMRRASGAASDYASSASRWAEDARSGLRDRSHRFAERARTLPEELDEAVQDHPLVLAALGVAVGAALGATLPATSIENRTLGQASDQLWEAAEGASERIGDAAEEAYDEAWRTAGSHGLNKEGLKDMARDVGSKFTSAAAGDGAQAPSSGNSSAGSSASGSAQSASQASTPPFASSPGGLQAGKRENTSQS